MSLLLRAPTVPYANEFYRDGARILYQPLLVDTVIKAFWAIVVAQIVQIGRNEPAFVVRLERNGWITPVTPIAPTTPNAAAIFPKGSMICATFLRRNNAEPTLAVL